LVSEVSFFVLQSPEFAEGIVNAGSPVSENIALLGSSVNIGVSP